MKQKLLFVHHVSSIGGASWCLYEVLMHLDRTKYVPYVLLRSNGPLVNKIHSLNIPVLIEPLLPVFPVYGRKQIFGILQLLKAILLSRKGCRAFDLCLKKISPDIVYFNTSAQILLAKTAYLAGIKHIIYHNREHWEPKGLLKIKLLIRNHIINSYIGKIFTITECGIMQLNSPIKSTLVRDWPSFSNQINFDVRRKYGLDKNTFVVLVTGGTQKIKGSLDVLLALSKMDSKRKTVIFILGFKERNIPRIKQILMKSMNYTSYYQKIINYSKNHTNVHLLKATPNIIAYLSACDVLVAPFHTAHAAKAALEAQFLAKPVILYDHPESHEYALKNISGFIIPIGDIQALASKLDSLATNPKKAANMGLRGAKFVRLHFTQDESMNTINLVGASQISTIENQNKEL